MEWPVEKVERAAIEFENADIELNSLFYKIWPNPYSQEPAVQR
jgi:hypothetical protein